MNFQEYLFGSINNSLMQLRQPKNVVGKSRHDAYVLSGIFTTSTQPRNSPGANVQDQRNNKPHRVSERYIKEEASQLLCVQIVSTP